MPSGRFHGTAGAWIASWAVLGRGGRRSRWAAAFLRRLLPGLTGANAGKFTVAILAKNYTFRSWYFSLRQTRKIKGL